MVEDDTDFEDILEGTVDEAKENIRNLENPDYEGLLEAEESGKDRKTLKDFIESQMASEDEETEEDAVEEEAVEDPEEVVSEIEEQTSGGIMGSYSRSSVLAGGLILGLVLGFVAASYSTTTTDAPGSQAPPETVQEAVKTVAGASPNVSVEVTEPTIEHSMYRMNVTQTIQTQNGTQQQTLGVFVTLDGRYLVPIQKQFGQVVSPTDLQAAVQQVQTQQQESPDTNTSE
jgi:hypothetical protein